MTAAESQQHLQSPLPAQALPPPIETVSLRPATVPDPVVVGLTGRDSRTFAELVGIAQHGHARILGGYLQQRARTPGASRLELRAQKAAQRRDRQDRQATVDIACMEAVRQADRIGLPIHFLPDDLRPRRVVRALTPAALALLLHDPTYDNLAMQARDNGKDNQRTNQRDFVRELGFYALGWAAKRVARQRNGR